MRTSNKALHLCWRYLLQLPFWAALILLVSTSLLVLALRFLLPQLELARPHLETWLNQQLPFQVSLGPMQGSLKRIDPKLSFAHLTLSYQEQRFLSAEHLEVELDLLATLLAREVRLKDVHLGGLDLWLEQTPQSWQVKGRPLTEATTETNTATTTNAATPSSPALNLHKLGSYLELFLVQGELNLSNLNLHLSNHTTETLTLSAETLRYLRWSGGKQFSFVLEAPSTQTSPAQLIITLEGQEVELHKTQVAAWFNFPLINLQDFQKFFSQHQHLHNLQGQLSLQGWLNLNAGQVNLDLQARQVNLSYGDKQKLHFASADLNLHGQAQAWSADWQLQDLHLNHYQFPQLKGRLRQDNNLTYLHLHQLDLAPLASSLSQEPNLSNYWRQALHTLQPQGQLHNLLITRQPTGQLDLQANLSQASVAAWEGAPQAQQLNGWLQADANGGQVVFADQALTLGFPDLYPHSWSFNSAQGRVYWEIDTQQNIWVLGENLAVSLPVPTAKAATVDVSGEFAFYAGAEDQRLYLNLGLMEAPVTAQQLLVPGHLLPNSLNTWLQQALPAGQIHQAGFIYTGSVKNHQAGSFQLLTDFSATSFKFQPDWPQATQATGQLQIIDSWISGQVHQANLGQAQLSQISFSSYANNQETHLKVTSQLESPLEVFPWLVSNSPLQTELPSALQEWGYSGQINGQLSLDLPLTTDEPSPSVELHSHIQHGQLNLSHADLLIQNIHGPLNFSLAAGLESSGLSGTLYGQAVTASFQHQQLNFNAQVSAQGLKHHWQLPKKLALHGTTQVQGHLNLEPLGQLKLNSNLIGLGLTTPLPWGKTPQQSLDFHLSLDFTQPDLPLSLQLADQASYLAYLEAPQRGQQLKLASHQVDSAQAPGQPGLHLDIQLDQLDLMPVITWAQNLWPNLTKQTPRTSNPATSQVQLGSLNLLLDSASWHTTQLGQIQLQLQFPATGMLALIDADLAQGQIWWPQPTATNPAPLEINLDYLHLPKASSTTKPSRQPTTVAATNADMLAKIDPQQLPPVNLNLAQLSYGSSQLGQLTAQMRPKNQGIELRPLQLQLGQSQLDASLEWVVTEDSHQPSLTLMQGQLQGQDIAPALRSLAAQEQVPLTSSKHQLRFSGSWPGSPLAFNLTQVQATLDLELQEGKFPQVDGSLNGLSRLISLVSADSLLRRLRLNFSDLKAGGLSYDNISGSLQLEDGYLISVKPSVITSPATRMTLSGSLDLIDETLDQELTLVLPVAQTLPLAAVLAGAPQVGAVIWITQKAISRLFEPFTQASYKITGTLQEPQTELRRVF